MQRADAEGVVLTTGWLSQQPSHVQTAIVRAARLVSFDRGDYILRAGEPPGDLHGVAAGSAGAYIVTRHRGPDLIHIVRTGFWIGGLSLFTGIPRGMSFKALEASVALHLPSGTVRNLIVAEPDIARAIGLIGVEGVQLLEEIASDLLIQRAEHRIAKVLLRVTLGGAGAVLDDAGGFRLTQTQLGEMANASRVMVNRVLSKLAAKGWIALGYNRISIVNRSAVLGLARASERA
jgi:CRP-like cAMP-binding protein